MIEDVDQRCGNGCRVFSFAGNGGRLPIENLGNIAEGYLSWITGKTVASGCASRALYQASGLQLQQDLHKKTSGDPVPLSNAPYPDRFLASILTG